VGYREGPHALSLAYPWALEWTYTPGETYRLRLSPTSLALGYADGTYAFGANFPWTFQSFSEASLRLERYGEPYLYARYEGGLYGGLAWGGWRGEAGYGPAGPSLRVAHTGTLSGLTYALQGGYAGGPELGFALAYPLSPFALSFRGSLLPQASFGLGLGYREGGLSGSLDLSPGRALLFLEWRGGPPPPQLGGGGGRGVRPGGFGGGALPPPPPAPPPSLFFPPPPSVF
jgi:hypothetical protein